LQHAGVGHRTLAQRLGGAPWTVEQEVQRQQGLSAWVAFDASGMHTLHSVHSAHSLHSLAPICTGRLISHASAAESGRNLSSVFQVDKRRNWAYNGSESCPRGGTGIHSRLRACALWAWRFESSRGHVCVSRALASSLAIPVLTRKAEPGLAGRSAT
jgi:hypothetical protein